MFICNDDYEVSEVPINIEQAMRAREVKERQRKTLEIRNTKRMHGHINTVNRATTMLGLHGIACHMQSRRLGSRIYAAANFACLLKVPKLHNFAKSWQTTSVKRQLGYFNKITRTELR